MSDLMTAIRAENDALRALVERGRVDLDGALREVSASETDAQARERGVQATGCAQ